MDLDAVGRGIAAGVEVQDAGRDVVVRIACQDALLHPARFPRDGRPSDARHGEEFVLRFRHERWSPSISYSRVSAVGNGPPCKRAVNRRPKRKPSVKRGTVPHDKTKFLVAYRERKRSRSVDSGRMRASERPNGLGQMRLLFMTSSRSTSRAVWSLPIPR